MSKRGAAESVRTFLAVELPPPQKEALGAVERHFDAQGSIVKLVSPLLLHITLRFLGSVPGSRLRDVEEAARQGADSVGPFTLQFTGLGAFPNERSPRVIWVGLGPDAGLDHLRRLFEETEIALEARGFGREPRAFSPHVTLIRARDGISAADRRTLAETLARARSAASVDGSFRVEELVVMRSDLSPAGPRYTPMARAMLTG